jgi:hypothetical protein
MQDILCVVIDRAAKALAEKRKTTNLHITIPDLWRYSG